jgi:hypothetical protein
MAKPAGNTAPNRWRPSVRSGDLVERIWPPNAVPSMVGIVLSIRPFTGAFNFVLVKWNDPRRGTQLHQPEHLEVLNASR